MPYKRKYSSKGKRVRSAAGTRKKNVKRRMAYRRKPKRVKTSMGLSLAGYIPPAKKIIMPYTATFLMRQGVSGGDMSFKGLGFYANSPYGPLQVTYPSTGWWTQQVGSITDSATGLSEWVTIKHPGSDETAKYRTAYCIGSRIRVSAVINQQAQSTADNYQDHVGIVLHTGTSSMSSEFGVTTVPATNYDQNRGGVNFESHKNLNKSICGIAHTNPNGTPKGVTLSTGYSWRKNNIGQSRDQSQFFADTRPNEQDTFCLGIYPLAQTELQPGAPTGKMPEMIFSVNIEYVCMLSEPNTTVQSTGWAYSSRKSRLY